MWHKYIRHGSVIVGVRKSPKLRDVIYEQPLLKVKLPEVFFDRIEKTDSIFDSFTASVKDYFPTSKSGR